MFLGNLLMLQNWAGPLEAPVVPSISGPLWTIAIEWHIYIFVGALFFARRSPLLVVVAVPFAFVPLSFLFGDAGLGSGQGMFGLWLMGYAAYVMLPYFRGSVALAGLGFAAYLFLLEPRNEYEPALYPLLAAAFYCAIARAARLPSAARWAHRMITFGAAYSFTLYLLHYPMLQWTRQLLDGWSGAVAGFVFANLLSAAVAWFTEMRHRQVASFLKWFFRIQNAQRRAAASEGRFSR